jgi:hypothetical protein
MHKTVIFTEQKGAKQLKIPQKALPLLGVLGFGQLIASAWLMCVFRHQYALRNSVESKFLN